MEKHQAEIRYRDELRPIYESLAARLRTLLEELIARAHISYAQVEYRAKTIDSFLEKLEKKNYATPFQDIKDFAGVRVITYYQDDVPRIAELVRGEFDIDANNSIDKLVQLDVDEFGYRSIHLVVSLKEPRKSLAEWSAFTNLSAEIQIRSVLQHAWASISHKLDYKIASQAPPELRRQLFRLSALLELADDEFQSLRERTDRVKRRYKKDVTQGELDIPLDLSSLSEFLKQKLDIEYWYNLGIELGMKSDQALLAELSTNIDADGGLSRLLLTLQAAGVLTIAEFEEMLPRLQKGAKDALLKFMQHVKKSNTEFYAVPADIITVLVSLEAAERLHPDFDWGGTYHDPIKNCLREVCKISVTTEKASTSTKRARK